MKSVATWVAVFGLCLQLVAGALCLSGSVPGPSAGDVDIAAWSICHAQADPDAGPQPAGGDQAPDHRQACAFCLLHCLGGLGVAPVDLPGRSVPVVAAGGKILAAIDRPLSRVPTDAAPRGPPLAG